MKTQTAVIEKIPFTFPLDVIKQVDEEGEFHVVGYAATTDFDMQGDIITEEALRDSSLDLIKNSTVLLNHDLKQPIGKVTKVQFDMHGLLIDVLISKTEPEIIQKIKEGVLNKFSIRGQVLERERKFMPELNRMANVIMRMALVEVSLVSVPANPEAKAIGWYVTKALQESDRKIEGGNPMKGNEVELEEITPKGEETPPKVTPPSNNQDKPNAETVKSEPAKPEPAPAPNAAPPASTSAPASQSVAEIQKNLLETLRVDLGQMISTEVAKQIESAVKSIPTLRKGLIQPESGAEDIKKQFESLTPEKKLKVALALQQA